MPEATNTQMQAFCDQRIRVRAEVARSLKGAFADDKAAIDDVYTRATGANQWADARTDGPPHLLAAGNAANPNDVTNYNAFITSFLAIINGTSANYAADAQMLRDNWNVFMRACVRPVSG